MASPVATVMGVLTVDCIDDSALAGEIIQAISAPAYVKGYHLGGLPVGYCLSYLLERQRHGSTSPPAGE